MSPRDASLHRKFSKASQRKTPVLCCLPGACVAAVAGTENALVCTCTPLSPGCPPIVQDAHAAASGGFNLYRAS